MPLEPLSLEAKLRVRDGLLRVMRQQAAKLISAIAETGSSKRTTNLSHGLNRTCIYLHAYYPELEGANGLPMQ